MGNNKMIVKNMLANLISMIISLSIGFFLSPYIIEKVSIEAYGFLGLAQNFINYAFIVTAALNSMASRFISIEIAKKNFKKANTYFSSVVITNIMMSLLLLIPMTILVCFLEHFINISINILSDIKFLWLFLFANFILSLIFNAYNVSTFASNRLDIDALFKIISTIIRALLLVILFGLFPPKMTWLGVSTFISGLIIIIGNFLYTQKVYPQFKVSKKFFNSKAIKEIMSSGIWNSFTALSSILLDGLDLLIANLYLGPECMGILALAKTLPGYLGSIISMLVNSFAPTFIASYAKEDKDLLKRQVISSMNIISFISTVPLAVFIILGYYFYKLWVPTQDSNVLQILSILTIGVILFTTPLKPLYTIYMVTNKIKFDSLCVFIQSVCSTATVFILLSLTNKDIIQANNSFYGLIIIAGVSTAYGIIRAVTFTPLYASYCMNVSKKTFYPPLIKNILIIAINLIIYYNMLKLLTINSWISLICSICIMAIVGYIINFYFFLTKSQRSKFINVITTKVYK